MPLPITLAEASKRIASRSLSPLELTRAALDRIEAFDHRIHAFNTVVAERALEQARSAEGDIARGRHRAALYHFLLTGEERTG